QASIHAAEYIGVALREPLVPFRTYLCEFWTRRSKCFAPERDKDEYFNYYFGMLFTEEPLIKDKKDIIAAKPQVTGDKESMVTMKEWIKVSSYFTPKSAFRYLYLGQFLKLGNDPPMMHGYYVIDDLVVEEISSFEALDKNLPLSVGTIIPLNAVTFLSGTTTFQDKSAKNTLSELADYLEANPGIKIRINGHTDSKGSKRSNVDLSNRRSEYVASILIEYGVKEYRIEWKGFGEEIPIDDNKTAAGRARNRRVEFEVVK
ncbi:MAG: OmpA family protein, partial [Saprospiraceae bacterium]|nr:OmpA family protein [Saprospiraceae bacterium]